MRNKIKTLFRCYWKYAARIFSIGSIFLSPSIFAVTVTVDIIDDTIWADTNSAYVISSNTDIQIGSLIKSATLTIQPGVTVLFEANSSMIVNGTLYAAGTVASPIIFGLATAGTTWNGIEFGDTSADIVYDVANAYVSGSVLDNVTISGVGSSVNGAIIIKSSYPKLDNLTIQNNATTGIYALLGASSLNTDILTIKNSQFLGNQISSRPQSPGISIFGGSEASVEIISNKFSSNTDINSTATALGGAVFISAVNKVEVRGNVFTSNVASLGGAIYIQKVPIVTGRPASLISGNMLSANKAKDGGGIYISLSDVIIQNNQIIGNQTTFKGAGLYTSQSTIVFTKNLLLKNKAVNTGGGMYIHDVAIDVKVTDNLFFENHSDLHGGGFDIHSGTVMLSGNTFSDNTATIKGDVLNINGGAGSFTGNSVQGIGATSLIVLGVPFDISGNTIVSNSNVIAAIRADVAMGITINNNNFFDNTGSYVFNNVLGGSNLDATSNWWGFTSSRIINSLNRGADSNALVDARTPLSNINANTPMSRPVGVFAKKILGDIGVSWVPAAEPNVVGYRVHWGSTSISETNDVRYEQTEDIGNTTSYTIPEARLMANSDYYIAVTSYNGARMTDANNTVINDNLAAGSESWYSAEFFVKKAAVINKGGGGGNTNGGDSGGGSSSFWWLTVIGLVIVYRRFSFKQTLN